METFDCIASRCSVRDFKDAPVSKEMTDRILQAALYAPVGMRAYDTLRLTCVTDRKTLADFLKMAREEMRDPEADPIHGAPALVFVSVKEPTHVAFANAACMIQNMMLEATDLGLGSLYVCGIVNALRGNAAFRKLLRLPEGFTPVGAAAVGYAETAPAVRPIPNTVTVADRID